LRRGIEEKRKGGDWRRGYGIRDGIRGGIGQKGERMGEDG